MTQRAKLVVHHGGPWRHYQWTELPGWEMLGTVQRGHEIGALARNLRTGQLVMLRAGAASALDQHLADCAGRLTRKSPRASGFFLTLRCSLARQRTEQITLTSVNTPLSF